MVRCILPSFNFYVQSALGALYGFNKLADSDARESRKTGFLFLHNSAVEYVVIAMQVVSFVIVWSSAISLAKNKLIRNILIEGEKKEQVERSHLQWVYVVFIGELFDVQH